MSDRFRIFNSYLSSCISYKDAYQKMIVGVREKKFGYITLNNVHTIVESYMDKDFCKIINSSYLSLADGKPLTLYARFQYKLRLPRIFGPTFFEKTLDWGQKDCLKHYFFGSTDSILIKMRAEVARKYPAANIVGMEAPVFGPFSNEENNRYLRNIQEKSPDIIWVGLGAPKQERWIYNNHDKISKGIFVGVGAGFSYLAGESKHAPQWMKNYSLEWIYRLFCEPRRLWKRYLKTNTIFIFYLLSELLFAKRK